MTISVEITAVTNSGDGVGRCNGKVIFVPYTAPGDLVEVVITEDKKKFSRGRLKKIVQPSPLRQKPHCVHFGTCGGCDWQHVDYETQLSWKAAHVAETLKRIGHVPESTLQPIVPSPHAFGYRNRIRGLTKDHRFFFHRKKSRETVEINHCPIADPRINTALSERRESFPGTSTEIVVNNGEVLVLPVSKARSTSLGFQQVNTPVHNQIMNAMLEKIPSNGTKSLVDLYCGKGQWTRVLAENFPDLDVLGIDSLPANIQEAQRAGGPANLQFLLGSVESVIADLALENAFVTVDPPRAGLSPEVLQALKSARPAGLLYVSCHQATLARDLKILCATDYIITSVQPFDMFPQTAHTEVLAALRIK